MSKSSQQPTTMASQTNLSAGTKVEVHGIPYASMAHFNGKLGKIENHHPLGNGYKVTFDDGSSQLIPTANLQAQQTIIPASSILPLSQPLPPQNFDTITGSEIGVIAGGRNTITRHVNVAGDQIVNIFNVSGAVQNEGDAPAEGPNSGAANIDDPADEGDAPGEGPNSGAADNEDPAAKTRANTAVAIAIPIGIALVITVVVVAWAIVNGRVFSTNQELRIAIQQCLHESPIGKCASSNWAMGTWDVSAVTDMSAMFKDAASFNEDISNWDVSEVTDMTEMFEGAKAFSQPLDKWDVSKVTRMSRMFYGASSFHQLLCKAPWIDAAKRNKMVHGDIFKNSPGKICWYTYNDKRAKSTTTTTSTTSTKSTTTTTSTTSTKGWAPKSKAELQTAIKECVKASTDCSKGPHGSIGSWDVSGVMDASYLFLEANKRDAKPVTGADKFNGDISKWDVSSVTAMHQMFSRASSFNGDISKWDVSRVKDMSAMFVLASSINDDLSKWDVSRVTEMYAMFAHASSFNGDISKWDVARVTEMNSMFYSASSFNGDISEWDVSKVKNMVGMFYSASSFTSDIAKWDVSRVIQMQHMFWGASSFNGDLSKWDVSRVTFMTKMFYSASSFNRTLCGAWIRHAAIGKPEMFEGSSGKIGTCTR